MYDVAGHDSPGNGSLAKLILAQTGCLEKMVVTPIVKNWLDKRSHLAPFTNCVTDGGL